MKLPLTLLISLLMLGRLNAGAAEAFSVAVFDFDAREEAIGNLGPQVATLVTATLSAEPQLLMVERAELDKILSEHELNLSGTVAPEAAVRIGNLIGAKVLVTGRIFRVDKEVVMVARIIGTETSRVYGEIVKAPATASVTDMALELANKIGATITEKGDTLIAKTPTREERIQRLIAALEGERRPAVSIRIPEEHFGAPVIDPAVETELGHILGRAGFPLVDAKSEDKPEIEITGEAFSAFGMRKGNLVSCRARVELLVRETATGRILLKDRQTSAAVDLTEQTAAKTALENAALDLAERIVTQLAE
jgi:hypothetical protein